MPHLSATNSLGLPRSLRAQLVTGALVLAAFASLGAVAQEPQPPAADGDRPGQGRVARCELTGTVDAGSAAYLVDCVRQAKEGGYEAMLLVLDTPGGALESTRQIVSAFLADSVPVLVWVGPSGARAGSAGVFLTLASHFAGMAPGTNIGAAHPVSGVTGEDPEKAGGKEMARKIENDTIAFVEAIAQQRSRNVEWSIRAVRESESVPAERAVELKVVEVMASSETELLELADGRKVQVEGQEHTLRTAGAPVVELIPTLRQRLVHWLANPSLAYILFMVGGLGLAIELSNPGLIFPGLIGLVCMVLAMVAFSALPMQAGAIVLLVLGVGLIVAEFFVGSGMLAVSGALLLALGGVLLVDRLDPSWFVDPTFHIPGRLVIPVAAVLGGMAVLITVRAAQSRKVPQHGADIGMIGEHGKARTDVGPEGGEVFVHGEIWQARSELPLPSGTPLAVKKVEGLTLWVEELKP